MGTIVNTSRIYPYTEYNTNVKYKVSISAFNSFTDYVNGQSVLGSLFTEPSQYVNGAIAFPFNIENLAYSTTTENIKVGDKDTSISATRLNNPNKILDLGTITIPKTFNNFLDNAPYTSIELYLPYIGFFNLNTDEVIGKTIHIYYAVNLDTGNADAFVQVDRGSASLTDDYVVMTASGKVGFEIPIGSTNARDITRNALMTGATIVAGIVTSVATANPAIGIGTAIAGTTRLATSSVAKYSKGGMSGGKNSGYAPQSPYVIITKPKQVSITNYNHLYGKPCGRTYQLSNLSGYTEVEQVHLTGFTTATEQEVHKIEQLLKNGVHL